MCLSHFKFIENLMTRDVCLFRDCHPDFLSDNNHLLIVRDLWRWKSVQCPSLIFLSLIFLPSSRLVHELFETSYHAKNLFPLSKTNQHYHCSYACRAASRLKVFLNPWLQEIANVLVGISVQRWGFPPIKLGEPVCLWKHEFSNHSNNGNPCKQELCPH